MGIAALGLTRRQRYSYPLRLWVAKVRAARGAARRPLGEPELVTASYG